ncbi:hypothetical protein [Kitasatospora sp. NBC_01539]|uniref:hypothetical protein n=1 Tax=Kitasatospora sp. NBC_01539 TaxID=2903577 RepID=UPI0038601156
MNRVRRQGADDVTRENAYPRYFFTNGSRDIVGLLTGTLDTVGVEWRVRERRSGHLDVSVARRASVALMDAHVGPKW